MYYFCSIIKYNFQTNNMNKLMSSFFILFITISVYGQELQGCYINNNDSLSFTNNKVVFSLSDFGALSTRIVGEGTYKYNDKFLLINTEEYSGNKSTYKMHESSKNEEQAITVFSLDGYPFKGVLIEFLSASNKVLGQSLTDDNGKATHPSNDKIKKIRVTSMGYDGIDFENKRGNDFSIVLAKNTVIEKQTVVLELTHSESEDEEALSVRLLSDNFDDDKNLDKALNKLQKRADKSNMLSKKLTKEYISEFYNN